MVRFHFLKIILLYDDRKEESFIKSFSSALLSSEAALYTVL